MSDPHGNGDDREPPQGGDEPAGQADPLVRLGEALQGARDLPPEEMARRVREALPATLAELTESNRQLREALRRRDALVASSAEQLRSAAEVVQFTDHGARLEEAARLLRAADDLERSLEPVAEPELAREPPLRAGPRPRVLVADDDADAREALAEVLHPECEVITAANGEEAVAMARDEHPDLVLMDLYMPRLDGLQALERIRSDPTNTELPVIFVSARGDDSVKARALDLGAVDYLQKPFSDRELRARVERTLRLARSHTALRTLAQTDPLTGLANLRAFRTRLEYEVKRARRYRTPLTCVMADMDNLKPVNDDFGHAVGDRAIATVAGVIREELRETDFGARYGGDEFVLLLPHTGADDGRVLAQRICARLRETVLEAAGHRVPVGASFGVACLRLDAADGAADALVRAADAELYRAKRGGRSRVSVAETGDAEGSRDQA
jgi:two-component system cell cycle response regulator